MSTTVIDIGKLPVRENIEVVAGNSSTRKYGLEYNADGTALSLAATTMTINISEHRGAEAALVAGGEVSDLTGNSGIVIDSEANGQFERFFNPTDTGTTLKPGEYAWEVNAVFAAGHSQIANRTLTIVYGDLTISEGATT